MLLRWYSRLPSASQLKSCGTLLTTEIPVVLPRKRVSDLRIVEFSRNIRCHSTCVYLARLIEVLDANFGEKREDTGGL